MTINLTPDQLALLDSINDMEHGFIANWYKALEEEVKDNLAFLLDNGLLEPDNEHQSFAITAKGKRFLLAG